MSPPPSPSAAAGSSSSPAAPTSNNNGVRSSHRYTPRVANFLFTAFLALAVCRCVGAIFVPIADCDETFNYWEPAHFLTYGTGKQTWEYSPEFALRSWLFVWIYSWPGFIINRVLGLGPDVVSKITVYYLSRCIAAVVSAGLETYFLGGVVLRFGARVSRICLLLLCTCAGFATSGASFLPSTFAMYCSFVAGGAILRLEAARYSALELHDAIEQQQKQQVEHPQHPAPNSPPPSPSMESPAAGAASPTSQQDTSSQPITENSGVAFVLASALKVCNVDIQRNSVRCIWAAVIGSVIGWPFAALSMVPFALAVLAHCRPLIVFPAREAIAALIASSVSVSILDSYYYCKTDGGAFSTWNLIAYNVFGGEGRGPELYGVEPWSFFFKNLLINFNLVFVLCLASVARSLLRVVMSRVFSSLPLNKTPSTTTQKKNNDNSNNTTASSGWIRHTDHDGTNLLCAAPFVLWFLFWMRIPHKEERFMVPVYPFVVLPASVLLGDFWDYCVPTPRPNSSSTDRNRNKNKKMFSKGVLHFTCTALLTATIVLNVSRSVAQWRYYGEADRAARWLYSHIDSKKTNAADPQKMMKQKIYTICVAKDWYRFPPSYFVPSNARLAFVESSAFTGALPRDFAVVTNDNNNNISATCTTSGPMNDLNQASPGQSIPLSEARAACDFVFDTSLGDNGRELRNAIITAANKGKKPTDGYREEGYVNVIRTGLFLDAAASPWFARILYVPVWSESMATWGKLFVAAIS